MPSVEHVSKTDAGLAAELRVGVMRLRRRLSNERHPDNQLSLGQMSVLGFLYRRGEMSVGELARLERVQPPSMTRIVNGLEATGLVSRRPHDTDGRQSLIDITEEGRDLVLRDRRRRDEWLARQLQALTPEQRAVLRAAAPILEGLASA